MDEERQEATTALGTVEEREGVPLPVAVAPALSLFGDEPKKAWEKMQDCVAIIKEAFEQYADEFVEALEFGRGERKRIQHHVKIEGWTFIGALVGVTSRSVRTERIEGDFDGERMEPSGEFWPDGNPKKSKVQAIRAGHGYRAWAEAVTLTGAVVGGAIGVCLSTEERWEKSDEYARSSMAQTRARSQAIAGVLRFLAEMAGYKGTPAAEMDGVQARQEQRVEGPKREKHTGWGSLLAALDSAAGFTEGVSKGLYGDAVRAVWQVELAKFGDIGDNYAEAMARLHEVLWLLRDNANALEVAPIEKVIEAWTEKWPEADADELATRIRAAAGEADPPLDAQVGLDAPGGYE